MLNKSPPLRLAGWLCLLLAVAALSRNVIAAHSIRARGIPERFPAPVAGADLPRLGVNAALEQYDEAQLDEALARIAAGGFTWVRQSFYWRQIEPQAGQFDWATADRIITAFSEYPQLRLLAVLEDTPDARGVVPIPDDRFIGFAGEFAARYGNSVDEYQIWDEPNLAAHWGGGPVNPPAYAALLAQAAEVIRRADPTARIILAGLAPTVESGPQNLSDVRYLEQLYQAGAAPFFNVVAGKPYGFDTGPDDRRVSESVLNFSRLILLREVMVKYGDAGKPVWASHWGWNALPAGWQGAPSIWGQTDETTQAARTVAALARARDEWPWAGALILQHFQPAVPPDDPQWGFALIGPDGVPRPIYAAVAAWAYALPDAAPTGGYPAANRYWQGKGAWRTGAPGADAPPDGGACEFRFIGSSIALTVRRGPYRGFLYVTVDGAPANALPRDRTGRAYVVLYDRAPSIATVPLATDLPAGPHTVTVTAEGSTGQWALVDWRVGSEPPRDGYGWKLAGLALAGLALAALLARDARRVNWEALIAGYRAGIEWGLALVALSAPFYLQPPGMFYQALSLSEILIILCAIAIAAWRWKNQAYAAGSLSPLHRAIGLWVGAALLAGLFAADRRAALFELRTVFLLPALYYALLHAADLSPAGRRRIVDMFVIGALGVAIIGLIQYALGRNLVSAEGELLRLRSVYPSPNNVGLYLERVWPLMAAIAAGDRERNARVRALYGLALLPVLLAMALSFSRGTLLLGAPAALLTMLNAAGRGATRPRRWLIGGILVCMGGAILLLGLPRFVSLFDLGEGSTFIRLEVWRSSLAMIREHPWFGIGPGNFLTAYRTRYVLPSAWQEFNLEHPHNIYLDHWTRMGIWGVLSGAAWMIGLSVALRRQIRSPHNPHRALSIGLAGSLAAVLAHGLVDNTLFFPDLALSFFLMTWLISPNSRDGLYYKQEIGNTDENALRIR